MGCAIQDLELSTRLPGGFLIRNSLSGSWAADSRDPPLLTPVTVTAKEQVGLAPEMDRVSLVSERLWGFFGRIRIKSRYQVPC
jgi:hypothetical protein